MMKIQPRDGRYWEPIDEEGEEEEEEDIYNPMDKDQEKQYEQY